MSITARFLASLREQIGRGEFVPDQAPKTVTKAWAASLDSTQPGNTAVAVDHDYVAMIHRLKTVKSWPYSTGNRRLAHANAR